MADGTSAICEAKIREVSGDKLTDHEVEEIIEKIQQRHRILQASGRIDDIDARMAEVAAEEGNKARLAAMLSRKQTALTILARDRTQAQIRNLRAQGLSPKAAVLAVFEGTVKGINQARQSVFATKLGFEGKFIGAMMDDVLKAAPAALKLIRNKEFAQDIVREMFELREGGAPGRTRNADAQAVAKVFARHAELSRQNLNLYGAAIGKLDDWGGPHAHDAVRMIEVTRDEWVNRIVPRLDLARTFPDQTEPEARAILGKMYDTIVTGKSDRLSAKRKGERVSPSNLAKSLSRDRVLHFKDADQWLSYQDEFGHGNIWTGMLSHQRRMAQKASLMQTLGPNPEVMMESLLDQMQAEIKRDPDLTSAQKQKQISALSTDDNTQIRQAISEAMGVTGGVNPDGITAARILGGYRAVQSMAKLGGAVISSISDLVTQSANMRYQGKPLLASYHDQMVGMIKGIARQTGETEKHVAFILGEGMDGMLDNIHSSTFANDGMPGAMSSAMTKFFRWSGLTGWTDNIRAVGARMMAAHMGVNASKGWADLPDKLRFVMGQHGIDESRWNVLRQATFEGPNGTTYLMPDRIADLPDEAFAPFMTGAVSPNKLARAKLDAEISLRRFYSDEINFGVIETDARSRRFTLRGTQAGTFTGEFLRLIFQFKGWPVAYTQRVLGRAVFGQRGGLDQSLHLAHLLVGATVAGYIAMTAKDYLKGYDRRKFVNPDGSMNLKTVGAAFTQGGGAGIYGDFLFGQVNRFGSGMLESAAGPGIGTASDLINNLMKARDGDVKAADWLNFALGNTPFVNLAYARAAADFLFLNTFREGLSPGFLERQRTNRRRDYGQSLLYPQTIGGQQ